MEIEPWMIPTYAMTVIASWEFGKFIGRLLVDWIKE